MSDRVITMPPVGQDLVAERLPAIFRLSAFGHRPLDASITECTASLFHEQASLKVAWLCRQPDIRMHPGALVSIRWQGRATSVDGCVRISRLVLVECPDRSVELFETIPTEWVSDRSLVKRADVLVKSLPSELKYFFNTIFWDDHRFHRFLVGPSSVSGHHRSRNGNFMHSVEVTESALKMVNETSPVCVQVLTLACLLHDAGKADEYRYDRHRQSYEMSPRGALLGHKVTVLEWIAVARSKCRIILPESHYLALLHALTAVKGAPAWMGLREPMSLEASILSMADRLSGQGDLISSLAPKGEGFGGYHKHMRGRPYVVRGETAQIPFL